MQTLDGGETWKVQRPSDGTSWEAVFFVNGSEGWIVGKDIIHTTDGGSTWKYQLRTNGSAIEGFTADHLQAFKRYGTERVLIAYDRDEAGEKAAGALAEKLIASGIECFRVHFPRGMDANEYASTVKPPQNPVPAPGFDKALDPTPPPPTSIYCQPSGSWR